MKLVKILLLITFALVGACRGDDNGNEASNELLQLSSLMAGAQLLNLGETNVEVAVDMPLVARFNTVLDTTSVTENFVLTDEFENPVMLQFSYLDQNKTVSAKPIEDLQNNHSYRLEIGQIRTVTNSNFEGLTYEFKTRQGQFDLTSITIDGLNLDTSARVYDISRNFEIVAKFPTPLKEGNLTNFISLSSLGSPITLTATLSDNNTQLTLVPEEQLNPIKKHSLIIGDGLESEDSHTFTGFNKDFYTEIDPTPKFPLISDDELMTLVQEQTFKYFWDFGHPVSGLARERNTSGETVTSGGSGFGIMAILVGIEREFITRAEGVDRLEQIVAFLEQADRFHGVWSHWLNGTTGKVIPFSANDDGGDLVETSYLAMGLITARQYLDSNDAGESNLIDAINDLWQTIEWDWYTQNENVLTWHWSPNFGWEKNLKIRGWNEALITYVMAAASPTHSIAKVVYDEGWARNGAMVNGSEFYDITLPLGNDHGGPLFFEHYTYMGLDPRNLSDQYANYWDQAVNHTLINRAYCITNPLNFVGYSEQAWGLTASDGNNGYSAHSPTNDRGVITPTAAISSIPYTPEFSMEALKYFYYTAGDKLWGEYGFYDAYNFTDNWVADSYLAIDQGPIIVMIENHRSAMLWDLFMSAPEIQVGLDKLGFTY